MEPNPENVSGEKVQKEVQKHVFEHSVDWGHVALGVAGIVLAYVLYQLLVESDPKNEDAPLGTEV